MPKFFVFFKFVEGTRKDFHSKYREVKGYRISLPQAAKALEETLKLIINTN